VSVKTTVDVYPKPKELFKNNASPKSLVLSKDPFDGVGSNRWCWVRMLALGDEERANVEEDEEDCLYHGMSNSRLTYLVGASVTESLQQIPSVRKYVIQKDFTYLATATSFAPVAFEETSNHEEVMAKTSSSQLRLHLDPGLVHERVVAPNNTGLLCLSRMLRQELQEYSKLMKNNETSKKIAYPRVVVFFANEEEARRCIPKLGDAIWGDFKLCVSFDDKLSARFDFSFSAAITTSELETHAKSFKIFTRSRNVERKSPRSVEISKKGIFDFE